MASSGRITLVNGTVSATGGQSAFAAPVRGAKFIVLYNVSVAGTTVSFQLQHSADNVTFNNVNSTTSTLTTTGQTVSHQLTSNNYNSLLPFVRMNISAITGSFTLTVNLLYELF